MNDADNFVDSDNNIIGISTPFLDYRDIKIGRKMQDAINDNKEFIESNLF